MGVAEVARFERVGGGNGFDMAVERRGKVWKSVPVAFSTRQFPGDGDL